MSKELKLKMMRQRIKLLESREGVENKNIVGKLGRRIRNLERV